MTMDNEELISDKGEGIREKGADIYSFPLFSSFFPGTLSFGLFQS